MATSYKILGQQAPADTSNTTLYTVPAATEAIVSTITVTSTTGTDSSFRLFVVPNAGAAGVGNAIAYDPLLAAGTFVSFTLGLTLRAGDRLIVRSGIGSSITFQAFGSELS